MDVFPVIVEIGGRKYSVLRLAGPCKQGTSYHYHEEDHPGVPHMAQHHHHDAKCQRRQAILEPLEPDEFETEILLREYKGKDG